MGSGATELITTIILICSCITGVAAVASLIISIGTRIKRKTLKEKTDERAIKSMILGLGYAKIVQLSEDYINHGYVTKDEYEDLKKYLYIPYKELGGNGVAEKLMSEVEKLPIHNNKIGGRL